MGHHDVPAAAATRAAAPPSLAGVHRDVCRGKGLGKVNQGQPEDGLQAGAGHSVADSQAGPCEGRTQQQQQQQQQRRGLQQQRRGLQQQHPQQQQPWR